jgi:hypothetical protein
VHREVVMKLGRRRVRGAITLLSAVSAAGLLVLARKSERQELSDAKPDVTVVGVAESEAQELSGGRH